MSDQSGSHSEGGDESSAGVAGARISSSESSNPVGDSSVGEAAGGGSENNSQDSNGKDGGAAKAILGESEVIDTGVISARGTEDGLVLRIDGRSDWEKVIGNIHELLDSRQKFFAGGQVALEWLERLPTKEQSAELENLLKENYQIEVVRPRPKIVAKSADSEKVSRGKRAVAVPLFDESESLLTANEASSLRRRSSTDSDKDKSSSQLMYAEEVFSVDGTGGDLHSQMSRILGDDLFYEDDANAKIVYGTLRSGQKIETPFSLIVVGDVNPGADLVAGGDIFVFGSLRGTAHAAAYDEYSFERVIVALQMRPMQLRIGSVISRGSNEVVSGAEIARIESRRIVVEAFSSRSFFWRKR